MRTYSRKIPDYQVIDDVHEMCRLCLEKAEESVPIFSDTNNFCASLALRIMMCVGLQITQEEYLPDMICAKCHNELNHYYEFKKRCVLSFQKLKSHVLAAKQSGLKLVKENKEICNLEIDEEETIEKPEMLNNIIPVIENQPEKVTDVNNLSSLNNDSVVEMPSTESIMEVHPDVTGFLSTILLELGIMTKHEDQIFIADESIKSIEIETEDDVKMTLEILEINQENQNGHIDDMTKNKNNLHTNQSNLEPCNKNKKMQRPKDNQSARCTICCKQFASASALRRHTLVHTGERPHVCAVCERAFSQREVLRRHELVHTENRPFKCSSCPKSFTQRGALVAHMRGHAAPGTRPLAIHQCTKCPKVFLHASGLSRHTMMHNGRVFPCTSCARRFSDKSSLLRHVRSKHRLIDAGMTSQGSVGQVGQMVGQ